MNINQITSTKLSILDGVELKSATFIDKSFPLHFHQNWSLGYIEFGVENISFNEFDFLLNRDALVLIPPYALHKNWGNKNSAWTYKALYISKDVIKRVSQKLKLDYELLASFPYFLSYGLSPLETTEKSVFATLEALFHDAMSDGVLTPIEKCSHDLFADILNFLILNYSAPITLDALEKEFKVNKFKLLKSFKKKIGLTPLAYQISMRIENSKQLFFKENSLTDIALESGFYDQSHFTHSFKKYVGVTPGAYKRNCNILQDWH